MIAAVPGGYVRLRRACHVRRTMYLFETYIHTEAELRVDQDNLNRILPTQDLIEKISTMPCLAGKACGLSGRTGRTDATGLDPLSMRIYTPEECERLDASFVVFCFSLSKFRCLALRPVKGDRASARAGYRRVRPGRPEMVILMVLFNIPGCENAYQQMENYSLK